MKLGDLLILDQPLWRLDEGDIVMIIELTEWEQRESYQVRRMKLLTRKGVWHRHDYDDDDSFRLP